METAVDCRETSPEADLVSLLMERGLTISTAESCTGGMISARLVNIPGASQVFEQGMVTYSNEAKMRLLGVKEETLKEFGAVSPQTAEEMAALSGRFHYEILCGIGKRVPRAYIRNGVLTETAACLNS